MRRIGIIGGGPAGMMAAIGASAVGNHVVILEKNEKLGKKLYITGKGRCNITNNGDIEEFIQKVNRNPFFCYSCFYGFTNVDMVNLLEEYGLKTKVERGGRIFPVSDKSSDVIKTLGRILKDNNVEISLNTPIDKVVKKGDIFQVSTNDKTLEFDSIIVATGGISYPMTGSTGFGYKVAKSFGHKIVSPFPTLVPIEIKDSFIKDLQGVSLRNVSLTIKQGKRKIFHDQGEMIFTHFGISGPIVISSSAYIGLLEDKNFTIILDLKPGLSVEALDRRILRDFEKYINKDIENGLNELLISKLIPVVLKLAKIESHKKLHQISKDERFALVKTIKEFPLSFNKLRPVEEGIVTGGGVSTEEVDPSTMESKLVKGLYFSGEVLDLDAMTGGYNLQIAYSTGYLAGISAGGKHDRN